MADKPPEDEPGAEERFEKGLAESLKLLPMTHPELVEKLRRERAEKKGRGPKAPPE